VGGRRVVQDVAAVFTADEIHMIDSEVGRYLLVAWRLVGSLPLDAVWWSTPQAIVSSGKVQTVSPGRFKLGVVFAGLSGFDQTVEVGFGDFANQSRSNSEGVIEFSIAEQT